MLTVKQYREVPGGLKILERTLGIINYHAILRPNKMWVGPLESSPLPSRQIQEVTLATYLISHEMVDQQVSTSIVYPKL